MILQKKDLKENETFILNMGKTKFWELNKKKMKN